MCSRSMNSKIDVNLPSIVGRKYIFELTPLLLRLTEYETPFKKMEIELLKSLKYSVSFISWDDKVEFCEDHLKHDVETIILKWFEEFGKCTTLSVKSVETVETVETLPKTPNSPNSPRLQRHLVKKLTFLKNFHYFRKTRPKGYSPRSPRTPSPRSPRTPSPRSPKEYSPRSPKEYSPRSPKEYSPLQYTEPLKPKKTSLRRELFVDNIS